MNINTCANYDMPYGASPGSTQCFLGHVVFSEYIERTPQVFSSRVVFFYLVTTGWIFDMSGYVRIQSIPLKTNRAIIKENPIDATLLIYLVLQTN